MADGEQGRVAMISGANRGIGNAVARRLHAEGYRLSLGVRRPSAFTDRAGLEGGADVELFAYEAAEAAHAPRWVEQTMARFGRIDVLVNNAGIHRNVTLESGTDAELDELLDINVKAPFRMIRAALPHLKASGSGRVVNISSMSGKRVRNLAVGYQMSKAAMVTLAHAVRRIGWDSGVRAVAVCPGYVRTDMAGGPTAPPRDQMTDPDELAGLIAAVVGLSNTGSVAELLVNCQYEHML
ncbi:NADP-dependent 3-hydroxy acid dehydrogenase YdfG [Stella humosa]|uniref:NADP-dependent 3-hydroxy acid dehydrogenase YdfG n=1 Tax=Stella humosa TaxID=94 RepID=A0A3N1M9X9_9PROT|nr:SDR family NAD(P)-dependent oxidoreductase [Stella humosa]ROQ00039.1 NADP-dependent 3-hydroxy acid dehydrogenase YdfG [Stella humosa]BBK30729.1 agropine synthesis reductase [Stella humosa]